MGWGILRLLGWLAYCPPCAWGILLVSRMAMTSFSWHRCSSEWSDVHVCYCQWQSVVQGSWHLRSKHRKIDCGGLLGKRCWLISLRFLPGLSLVSLLVSSTAAVAVLFCFCCFCCCGDTWSWWCCSGWCRRLVLVLLFVLMSCRSTFFITDFAKLWFILFTVIVVVLVW